MRITLPRIGLGGAPLGNMFHPLSEETADATLNAAWDAGFRYYDVSPHYGAGLAEQRFGRLLSGKPRDEYVLSTKVGRLLQPASQPENAKPFVDELPNKRVPDYSADGARRSIEDSLERMGVDRLDVVFIHDVSEDQWGPQWREYFQQAMNGAAKALTQLRDEGVIRGWGLGSTGSSHAAWLWSRATRTCSCWPAATRCWSTTRRWTPCSRPAWHATLASSLAGRSTPASWPVAITMSTTRSHHRSPSAGSSSRPLPSAAASICGPPPCISAWPTRWSPRSSGHGQSRASSAVHGILQRPGAPGVLADPQARRPAARGCAGADLTSAKR